MELSKLASAVFNDVEAGLSGMNANPNMSLEQLEDEIIETRETVVKEWYLKGVLKSHDLMLAINCIPVDCADPAQCCYMDSGKSELHFEIPPLMNDMGNDAIEWIGSIDKEQRYDVYYTRDAVKYRFFKKRGAEKPFVYIQKTPNKNGMYDGWVFNVPFVKQISIIAVFRDPRQLEVFNCCQPSDYLELGSVSNEIKRRLTEQKLRYYRGAQVLPNTQTPR